MARKLKLKKDKDFYAKARKKTSVNFTKELLEKMYTAERKSTREISKTLRVGKTTIEYYLKKFDIKRRSIAEANKIHSRQSNWIKGLSKEKDIRVRRLADKIKLAYKSKRLKRIIALEKKFGIPLEAILRKLYTSNKLNQEQIAKKLNFSKSIIIEFMKKFNIPIRPKYSYIASLRGKKHSMYGKTWEKLYGKEESAKRKQIRSSFFRELTIKRIKNKEFPFFDTEIEKNMAKELINRGIPFVKQFSVNNKFVCDFAIPAFKIIIECDGDYWHANPKLFAEKELSRTQKNNLKRDVYKDKFLFKEGWKVFRFFESDIKFSVSKCVDKIEEAIKFKIKELIKSPFDSLMNKQ